MEKNIATEPSTENKNVTETIASEQDSRWLSNHNTGVIEGGGTNFAVVYSSNPKVNQNWTIGRVSGTAGKIDIEVRNGAAVVLGSKAFQNDGDTPLTVFIPWDAGTCTVRVYNNNSYAGSWTISIST